MADPMPAFLCPDHGTCMACRECWQERYDKMAEIARELAEDLRKSYDVADMGVNLESLARYDRVMGGGDA